MRVKAVDIARELGISKSAVSLALNNKSGVSEQTRAEVLACKKRLEEGAVRPQETSPLPAAGDQIIKVVVVSDIINENDYGELDLWTNVITVFGRIARQNGYTLGITYFVRENDVEQDIIRECNAVNVAGIIIFGSELTASDMSWLVKIKKPTVVFDNDLADDRFSSVMVNNRDGIRKSIDYFHKNGIRDIRYLANANALYNDDARRRAFQIEMLEHNLEYSDDRIVLLGDHIEEVYQNMLVYLENHPLPQAFLTESYHQSVGVIRAFRQKNIRVPEDVSLIGIDELPSYLTGDCILTTIRIPHAERARLVMTLLFGEIASPCEYKSKVYMNCKLIEGTSVKK